MRFLIAGYGSIGRRHFHNLRSLGVEDILFYRTHKSAINDDELAGYVVETDLEKALSHGPDAVIISNPTALHLDVAIPAAQAGCDILLEKPVSHNMKRIDTFERIVKEKDVRVLVGFHLRFHPGLRLVKNLLSSKEIGFPLSARAHWGEYLPGWHPWEDYRKGYSARKDLGGGVLLTLSHPLDYMIWLLGDMSKGWALLGYDSNLELDGVEDSAEIGFEMENGVIGSIHLDYYQKPITHWLEIVGTNGTIRWNYVHGSVRIYNNDSKSWKEFPTKDEFDRNSLFQSEMEHFLDVVQGRDKPTCPLSAGVRVQKLIHGFKTSSKTGRMVHFG